MIKYLLLLTIPGLISIRTLSFAAYNWREGNKLGATGVALLAAACAGVPFIVILLKADV